MKRREFIAGIGGTFPSPVVAKASPSILNPLQRDPFSLKRSRSVSLHILRGLRSTTAAQ